MHCQKSGQDKLTSAEVRYQLRFGAGLLLNKLFGNFIIIILLSISTGAGPASIPCPSAMQNVVRQVRQKHPNDADLFVLNYFR